MRFLLILFLTAASAWAAISVKTKEWQPACDGSSLEIIRDHGVTQSITATAIHSEVVTQWSIHFSEGKPVSEEYRESIRFRHESGNHAGEPTGQVKLKTIKTWIPKDGVFQIKDPRLAKEFQEILAS